VAKPFKNPFEAVGFYVVVIIFILFTLFPLLWVMRLSMDDADSMAKNPGTVVPEKVILDDPKDKRQPVVAAFVRDHLQDTFTLDSTAQPATVLIPKFATI
jgi:ABC-type glycerol-3-phosphate transport system permease component